MFSELAVVPSNFARVHDAVVPTSVLVRDAAVSVVSSSPSSKPAKAYKAVAAELLEGM